MEFAASFVERSRPGALAALAALAEEHAIEVVCGDLLLFPKASISTKLSISELSISTKTSVSTELSVPAKTSISKLSISAELSFSAKASISTETSVSAEFPIPTTTKTSVSQTVSRTTERPLFRVAKAATSPSETARLETIRTESGLLRRSIRLFASLAIILSSITRRFAVALQFFIRQTVLVQTIIQIASAFAFALREK